MEKQDFSIEQLTEFSPKTAEEIRELTKQIGKNYKELSDQDVKDMLVSKTNTLLVARAEEKIVAMITLLIFRIPYVKKGYIDDLVVDTAFRKHGLGTILLKKALEIAKENGVSYVDLTAHPKREAGNKLYEKLGFKKRDTNVYRLNYTYEEI